MTERKPLKIALGNKARVGKDTFADIVAETHAARRFMFSQYIKSIAEHTQAVLGVPISKDPTLLQKLGTLLREHYSDDVFANSLIDQIKEYCASYPNDIILVTDMREPIEMRMLKEVGFVTIKITRENRVIDRDPNHSSEIALDNAQFDYHLTNDGTVDEFRTKVNELIDKLS